MSSMDFSRRDFLRGAVMLAGAGGRLAFRGFRGTYEVEATSNGRTVKRQFAVGGAASAPVEIVVA